MQKGLSPIAALLLLLLLLLSSITVAVDAWLLSSSSSSGCRKVSVIVRPRQQQHRSSTMVHTSLLQARPSWFFTFRHVQPFLERIHAPSSSLSLSSPSFSVTMLRHSSRPDTDPVDDSNDMNDDDDDEELCADEEECEIDWDAMPLDETASSASSSSSSSSARTRLEMQWELTEAAEDCDVEVPTSCGSEPCQECAGQGHKPCRFCHGTAVLYMRKPPSPPTASACYDIAFASTSRFGSLLPTTTTAQTAAVEEHTFDFSACPICQNGKEVCRSCQGTGWVASWTHWQEPAH